MANNIHPQACVEPGAQLGDNVTVEAFAVVKSGVTLEDGVVIKSHAYITGDTTIGARTIVYPSASIGTAPQSISFQGEKTKILIGSDCQIREFVTINSSNGEGTSVQIGNNCLLMAYCHVAHNCTIGNHVVMANHATLAGHIILGDYVIVGGMTAVHQFVRIGRNAMVGGMSRVSHDVPPYTLGAGMPFKFGGLNLIGLKRHGFPLEVRSKLSAAFRHVYRSGLHLDDALAKIEDEIEQVPEVAYWVEFCRTSRRGLIGLQGDHEGATMLEDGTTDNGEVALSALQMS